MAINGFLYDIISPNDGIGIHTRLKSEVLPVRLRFRVLCGYTRMEQRRYLGYCGLTACGFDSHYPYSNPIFLF